MQGTLKKLVKGELSLPMTFWGWGVGVGFLLNLVGILGIYTNVSYLLPISYILREVLLLLVCSGLFFHLKRKMTLWGILASIIVILEVIIGAIMIVGLHPLFFA